MSEKYQGRTLSDHVWFDDMAFTVTPDGHDVIGDAIKGGMGILQGGRRIEPADFFINPPITKAAHRLGETT
jgi:hypothetical protein